MFKVMDKKPTEIKPITFAKKIKKLPIIIENKNIEMHCVLYDLYFFFCNLFALFGKGKNDVQLLVFNCLIFSELIMFGIYFFMFCNVVPLSCFDIKKFKIKKKMTTFENEKQTLTQQPLLEEENIKVILKHWTQILQIKFGWVHDLNKIIIKYTITVFIFNIFRSSSKLFKSFDGHITSVLSIDYSILDDDHQFICSGSSDETICVWNVENNKQIQSFHGHSAWVNCVKFSSYHYHNYRRHVICSSSNDKTIRFWDIKHNQQLQVFNEHTNNVCGIEFSSFSGGRYLCSGSGDRTIRLWDVETYKSLHIFDGHVHSVRCVDISPLQSNNNNKSNNIGVIGGNGYTICSGSWDTTIRIWDIETTKQLIIFRGHKYIVHSVKYGPNELGNIILSGSKDDSVRLWDIRSGQQIQVFNGHISDVNVVEYSPFVVNSNIEIGNNGNVICSGSEDRTIRFWDIRINKNELIFDTTQTLIYFTVYRNVYLCLRKIFIFSKKYVLTKLLCIFFEPKTLLNERQHNAKLSNLHIKIDFTITTGQFILSEN
ncbi:WD-40 repeat protein [Reticulomyxa filosa]|uniref:WD-40 repeat protein n=1 Tax=Reticulomyxa filosa TaxID=46433 RepID=X6LYJ9_RETFI|nr:WD-40 repeat protein [Reticulomyxa filosa]|eukprot:ETO06242.1 WD-40 repeat protein [Reticulomyxa filosa]